MSDTDKIALKYIRHHSAEWMPCETIEEAVGVAYWMSEDGQGYPYEVVSLDGSVLLDEKELYSRMAAYDDDRPAPLPSTPPPQIPSADKAASEAFAKFMGQGTASAREWADLPDEIREVWRKRTAE